MRYSTGHLLISLLTVSVRILRFNSFAPSWIFFTQTLCIHASWWIFFNKIMRKKKRTTVFTMTKWKTWQIHCIFVFHFMLLFVSVYIYIFSWYSVFSTFPSPLSYFHSKLLCCLWESKLLIPSCSLSPLLCLPFNFSFRYF